MTSDQSDFDDEPAGGSDDDEEYDEVKASSSAGSGSGASRTSYDDDEDDDDDDFDSAPKKKKKKEKSKSKAKEKSVKAAPKGSTAPAAKASKKSKATSDAPPPAGDTLQGLSVASSSAAAASPRAETGAPTAAPTTAPPPDAAKQAPSPPAAKPKAKAAATASGKGGASAASAAGSASAAGGGVKMLGKPRNGQPPLRAGCDTGETIQFLLEDDMRPYPATGILTVFQDRAGVALKKESIEATMGSMPEEFVKRKEIQSKAFLFWANQDDTPVLTRDERKTIQCETAELARELKGLTSAAASAEREAQRLRSEPTDKELEDEEFQLGIQTTEKQERINELAKRANAISTSDVNKLKRQFNKYRDVWAKRRRQCNELVEVLADGMDKKPKDVRTLVDIETDEMAKAPLPVALVVK